MLQLNDLSVAFGSKRVLDGLSLQVASGETLALLGPSGEGKSTLLNVVAGLQAASQGEVWLHGRRLDGEPPEARRIAMMFQQHALFPHLDAAANVAFGLEMRGVARREARRQAEAALAAVGLAGREAALCHQLSGGEQQRVALARALITAPQLFLLDEPFSSLDAHLKQQLLADVRQRLAAAGQPALLVTHDKAEAFALADRIAIMQGGRILQQGTVAEVLAAPASGWVARFLGFANVFDDYCIPPQAFVLAEDQPQREILALAVQAEGCLLTLAGDGGQHWQLLLGMRELASRAWPQVGERLALGLDGSQLLRW